MRAIFEKYRQNAGLCVWRLAAKISILKISDERARIFRPKEMGVGLPTGAEAAVHTCRRYINYSTSKVAVVGNRGTKFFPYLSKHNVSKWNLRYIWTIFLLLRDTRFYAFRHFPLQGTPPVPPYINSKISTNPRCTLKGGGVPYQKCQNV